MSKGNTNGTSNTSPEVYTNTYVIPSPQDSSDIILPSPPKIIICHSGGDLVTGLDTVWYPGVKYISKGITTLYTSNMIELYGRRCNLTIEGNVIKQWVSDINGFFMYVIY